MITEEKNCFFCSQSIEYIDFKNSELLRKFISGHAKMVPPQRSGTCRRHQNKLSHAIKRARFMAILPFTTR